MKLRKIAIVKLRQPNKGGQSMSGIDVHPKRCELCPPDEETCYCYDDKPSVYLTESQLDEIVKEFVKPAVSEDDRRLKMTVLSLFSDLRNCRAEYDEERAAHNAHVVELIETESQLQQLLEENERLTKEIEQVKKERDKWKASTEEEFSERYAAENKLKLAHEELAEKDKVLEWIRDAGTDYLSINKAREVLTKYKEAETV